MKIAFLCLNLVDTLRRAEAFIQNCPSDDFTIVIIREWHDRDLRPSVRYQIPFSNVSYIEDTCFDAADFDLVLPNNDKACDFLFSTVYSGQLPNLSNKVVFNRVASNFGEFDMLRSNVDSNTHFADNDYVMLKPANSSGGFSELNLCYNKRRFNEVEPYNTSDFIIQEFVDSSDIILLSFVSNGTDLVLYDVVEQEFKQSKNLNIFTSFIKSNLYLRDVYAALIEKTRRFFKFAGYTEFKGFFGIQFLQHNGKMYPIDCNLRTGPLAMELELRGILDTRMYKAMPFFFGDNQCKMYLEEPQNYQSYICYAEENGKLTTSRNFTPNHETRIAITNDKTSGTFRSDYTMYVEDARFNSSLDSGKWTFNSSVAARFEQEALLHIPDYLRVIDLCVTEISNTYDKTAYILDVGSAIGKTVDTLYSAGFINVYGTEKSIDMIDMSAHRDRIIHTAECPPSPNGQGWDCVLVNWTAHFIPMRSTFIRNIRKQLGGASKLILTDKMTATDAEISEYYNFKLGMGLSPEQIDAKSKSLEGVLIPMPFKWYEATLLELGAKNITILNKRFMFYTIQCEFE